MRLPHQLSFLSSHNMERPPRQQGGVVSVLLRLGGCLGNAGAPWGLLETRNQSCQPLSQRMDSLLKTPLTCLVHQLSLISASDTERPPWQQVEAVIRAADAGVFTEGGDMQETSSGG